MVNATVVGVFLSIALMVLAVILWVLGRWRFKTKPPTSNAPWEQFEGRTHRENIEPMDPEELLLRSNYDEKRIAELQQKYGVAPRKTASIEEREEGSANLFDESVDTMVQFYTGSVHMAETAEEVEQRRKFEQEAFGETPSTQIKLPHLEQDEED